MPAPAEIYDLVATDADIDRLADQLYGLTENEVRIVKGQA